MIVIGVVGGIASGKSQVTRILEELGAAVLDADRVGHQVLRLEHVKAELVRIWGESILDSQNNVDRKALAEIVFRPDSIVNSDPLRNIRQHPRLRGSIQEILESDLQEVESNQCLEFKTEDNEATITNDSRLKSRDQDLGMSVADDGSAAADCLGAESLGLQTESEIAGPEQQSDLDILESIVHPEIKTRLESQIRERTAENYPAIVLDAPVMFKAGWDRICDLILFVNCSQATRASRAGKRGWTEQEFESREQLQVPVKLKRFLSDFVVENEGSLADLEAQVKSIWNSQIQK